MKLGFPYGISSPSLTRWVAFQRLISIQRQRGAQVGWAAMNRIVDAELRAITRATVERERQEFQLMKQSLSSEGV